MLLLELGLFHTLGATGMWHNAPGMGADARERPVRGQAKLSRRGFIQLGAMGAAGWALRGVPRLVDGAPAFPEADRLGRVCRKMDVKARPDIASETLSVLYEDAVVAWLRERAGSYPIWMNQRWVEIEAGYVWAGYLQPVRNLPNKPVASLPETSIGPGMWVEVTVPWTDIVLDNPPARSPWLKDAVAPRLYYSQILWVDKIKTFDSGRVWYRLNEKFGYGDVLWAAAEAFRPLGDDDWAPIHPDVSDKRVEVNLSYQTLSCFEGNDEVYFCRISSGAKFDSQGNAVDKWATPLGPHPIWRKVMSLHMSGGTTGGGYDLPGIGWTTLFSGDGVAIHSTFWHNNFGEPMSHGCVNASPEDARWVFRWTTPQVEPIPGDVTVSMPGGTVVKVVEA